jgi:hypothetical protein
MACGGRFPLGSRVSTQRMGKGSKPERSHNAVPVQISTVGSPSPSQSTLSVCQTVSESCKTCSSAGRRVPTTRGRVDRLPATLGRGLMKHGIESASGDQGHLLRIGMQTQCQHPVGGIAHQLDGTVGKPSTNQADRLMRPHRNSFVPLAQAFTHLRGGCQSAQERQSPALRASKAR